METVGFIIIYSIMGYWALRTIKEAVIEQGKVHAEEKLKKEALAKLEERVKTREQAEKVRLAHESMAKMYKAREVRMNKKNSRLV